MPDLIDYFLPYQRRWILAEEPVVVGEKSRRIGWTYASSFRAVKRRLHVGTDLYYSSADLSAAGEFVEDCQRWARVFKAVAKPGEQTIDEADGMRALVLRFENGAKIVAGSSNPKFFRSKGGDADADEFAFHREPRELYKAMQPAARVWGHPMRLWSTHNGEGSFFNQLVKEAKKRQDAGRQSQVTAADDVAGGAAPAPAGPSLCLHTVTLLDAVEQGLVEKIKRLPGPDPVARRDFIEEIRASCPDEDAWNEEYLCAPSSVQAALLSYELIQGCESSEVGGGGQGLEVRGQRLGVRGQRLGGAAETGGIPFLTSDLQPLTSLFAGFDVGRKHDRSVLWVVERVGDVLWTRGLRVLEGVNFTAQEEMLTAFLKAREVRRLCVDSTGIGAMLAERLVQRFGHRVEAVHFTAAVKSDLAMPLVRLFQDRLVRIPADPEVREDLHKVRKVVTASNNVRLEADRDDKTGHADRFWALALACHAAAEAHGRPTASMARKPPGW